MQRNLTNCPRRRAPARTGAVTVLALLAILALAATGCRGNKSPAPPVHLNPNMDFMQYYTGQEKNSWFPDERAMRPPVEGTVAHGRELGDPGYTEGRGADGRLTDALPERLTLDEALLTRGQQRYQIYCAPCHAGSGEGNGIVMRRGFKVPAPSYFDPRLQAMPLGYFYDVITNGKGTMLPYAAQVPVDDRWAIAAWVRVLQVSRRATAADVPRSDLEELQRSAP